LLLPLLQEFLSPTELTLADQINSMNLPVHVAVAEAPLLPGPSGALPTVQEAAPVQDAVSVVLVLVLVLPCRCARLLYQQILLRLTARRQGCMRLQFAEAMANLLCVGL
jgi:hypothetical protein